MQNPDFIFGRRAVEEAIASGKEIDKILLRKDSHGGMEDFFKLLKTRPDIVVQKVPAERLNRITRKNHQGVIAFLSPIAYYDLETLVPDLFEAGRTPLVVVLDGVTDVRNFGAISRTCECSGVDAIIIPERNSVSVNADAVKTSAGALLHLPVARVKSLGYALKYLKDSGVAIVGATEKSEKTYTTVDYTLPTAIVMGAEDVGLSADSLRRCDDLVGIPMKGKVNSLNVSVAAGIMIYEAVRQRMNAGVF